MSDVEHHLEQTIRSLDEHAQDAGHCDEFRAQCHNEVPKLKAELKQLRANRRG